MKRVIGRIGALALVVLLVVYAWPIWNVVSDRYEDWTRARREAKQRAEWARKARLRVPDLLIAKDYPHLQAIIDSARSVEVYRLYPIALQLHRKMGLVTPNGMWIDKKIPVVFGTWWPRFKEAFLSKPLMYTTRSPSTQTAPLYVRCSGSHGKADILLVCEHGSHLEISWADSSGTHLLKRQAISMFMDAEDSTISRLRVGIPID